MDLNQAVVLVTGSARGVGRAIAEGFVARGSRVAMVDVLEDVLTDTADTLIQSGGTVLPIVADITLPEDVEALVETVQTTFGPIDVLVNNAGTFSVIGPVWEADPDRWFRDIRVNLFGSFLVSRSVVKGMVKRETGYVINMVSSGGVGDPHAYSTSYASSKTGLMRLTEGLAQEAREFGVKVFAVAPPAILTEMTRFIMNDPGGKRWRPGFGKDLAAGKGFPASGVADLILELVSGKADELTGRYFKVKDSLEKILENTDEILARDQLTLRIRT